jgi:hypothetical protein
VSARRVLLFTVTVLLLPALARAQAEPEWYSRASCRDHYRAPAGDLLPAELPKQVVLRDLMEKPLARTRKELEMVCSVEARAWKSQRPLTFVVVVAIAPFRSADESVIEEGEHQLRLGVYRQQPDGRLQLVARTAQPAPLGEDESFSSLDLAPYKLTATEYAFGVRSLRHFIWPGGGGDNEYLQVFRVQGNAIRPILSTLMKSAYERNGEMIEPGMWEKVSDGDEQGAEISVLKTRTRGIFNWKIKAGRSSTVIRWQGDSYESAQVVADVNN